MKRLQILALVMLVGLLCVPNAWAVPTLSFSVDGAVPVLCVDEAGCDIALLANGAVGISAGLNVVAGATVFTAPLAAGSIYSLNVTTGLTKPAIGSANNPQMDLNSINLQGTGGAHTLTIMFSETDFLFAPSNGLGAFGGTITPNGSTVTASAFFDDTTNALFSLASQIFTTGALSGPAFCAGGGAIACPLVPNLTGPGPSTAPYSLTQILTLSTTGAGTLFSGDFSLQMVPEPMSVVLFGSVLLVTMGALRRKIGQSA